MGNGHPIAAVITRSDIVDRFGEQTTYFSTFGGNPVACAAALAVLDVIQDEGLVENALTIGGWLRDAIGELATRHPVIGDVRGRGLMMGVELVTNDEQRSPDPNAAGRVREAMAEAGVLIGTSGRAGNTLKIRPPLSIRREEAELIVSVLAEVLGG
jgi:4-aminobutyrate aminotransferase-like enzyme